MTVGYARYGNMPAPSLAAHSRWPVCSARAACWNHVRVKCRCASPAAPHLGCCRLGCASPPGAPQAAASSSSIPAHHMIIAQVAEGQERECGAEGRTGGKKAEGNQGRAQHAA